jgi:hypothetical protein
MSVLRSLIAHHRFGHGPELFVKPQILSRRGQVLRQIVDPKCASYSNLLRTP